MSRPLNYTLGNKAVCREPGDLSCSEYNCFESDECQLGADDPCQLSNDLCVSKLDQDVMTINHIKTV